MQSQRKQFANFTRDPNLPENIWISGDGVFVTFDTSAAHMMDSSSNNETGSKSQVLAQFVVEETKGRQVNTLTTPQPVNNKNVVVNGKLFPPGDLEPLPISSARLESNNSVQQQQIHCGECSIGFSSGDGFFKHWLDHHCKLAYQEGQKQEQPKSDQCEKCHHVFVRGSPKCLEHSSRCCSSTRKRKLDPPKGKKLAANNVSCGICSLDLKTITTFFLHWLETHQSILDFLQEVWSCSSCVPSKLFPSEKSVLEHVQESHTSLKVSLLKCPKCQKLYCDAASFKSHELNHMVSGNCQNCQIDVSDLSLHTTQSHEVQCKLCHCQISPSNIRGHYCQVHKFDVIWNRQNKLQNLNTESPDGELVKIEKKASDSASEVIEKAVKRTCKACHVRFGSEKLLEKHYKANHEYQCKFCEAIMDKDVYGDHLRLHLASERKKGSS